MFPTLRRPTTRPFFFLLRLGPGRRHLGRRGLRGAGRLSFIFRQTRPASAVRRRIFDFCGRVTAPTRSHLPTEPESKKAVSLRRHALSPPHPHDVPPKPFLPHPPEGPCASFSFESVRGPHNLIDRAGAFLNRAVPSRFRRPSGLNGPPPFFLERRSTPRLRGGRRQVCSPNRSGSPSMPNERSHFLRRAAPARARRLSLGWPGLP